jgi:hypothetical protein
LKRPRLAVAAVLAFSFLIWLFGPTQPPPVAAPRDGDCLELVLWTNGFHSDLRAPVEIFPADHPLRRLYPGADSFLIGWGEERFFRSNVFRIELALDAIVPPSPSVMHVIGGAENAEGYLGPRAKLEHVVIPVSREGAAGLVAYVDRTLALDAAGTPIVVAPGKVIGRSSFLRARGSFHLFNLCNQWMARALRAAGVNVNARAAWLGRGLVREVRRERPAGCAQSHKPASRPI